jgi:hypothetical protein
MTLFIKTQRQSFEISDAYVMALTFILFFGVTKIIKQVIEKKINNNNNNKEIKIHNPRGGSAQIQLSDDNELALIILSCIQDNQQYLVTNPEIKQFIFSLVTKKLKNESLTITPNMIRFLALKLITKDQTLLVKIGNVVLSSNNRVRLLTRLAGTATIAILGALFSLFPYAVLMAIMYFDGTQNCGYNCNAHFEHLPKEVPVKIYSKQLAGHVIIAENNDARQVEIYIPAKLPDEVVHIKTGQKIVKKSYELSRKKAQQVKFSEFKKTDPVLSQFKNILEPDVPQKSCPINHIHDIINIRID